MKHNLTYRPVIDVFTGVHGEKYPIGHTGRMEADGTHYSMTVIPIREDYNDRFLGSLGGDGYLVINGINRQAYLFKGTGYLDLDYLTEKLGRGLTICDMENVIHLLHAMLPIRTAPKYEAE